MNSSVTEPKEEEAQLLSEREGEQLKLRLYSGDGRSEIISVPASASVGSLRLAICEALVIPSRRASLLQVGVHRSLEQRLKQRQLGRKELGAAKSPIKQEQVELSQYKEEELLLNTAIEHLSTLLVHNCSELAPRATYTSIKKLRSMRERGRDVDMEALNVLRSVLSRIVLRPREAGLRRLRVSSLQRLLKKADAFALLQLLGFVRTGELYILPEAASLDLMRTVLHELYGSEKAWIQYEMEEQQKRKDEQEKTDEDVAESVTKPTFQLKPPSNPQKDTQALPDYSSYFLLGFVVLLVAILVGNSIRSHSAERHQQQLEDSLVQEQKERSHLKESPVEDVHPVKSVLPSQQEENRFLGGEKSTASPPTFSSGR